MRGRRRLRKWREEPRYNLLALKQMIDRWYECKVPPRNTWSLFGQSNAVHEFLNLPSRDEELSEISAQIAASKINTGTSWTNKPNVIISRYPKEITDAIMDSVR